MAFRSTSLVRKSCIHSTVILAISFLGVHCPLSAASFTTQVFATGAAVNGTQPDSVTVGGGSVWIEYGNGAPSTNYTGSGTIVQYSMTGTVQSTYKIAGSVDGLKYNPNTGQVWALQNQDASSQLTIINPLTKTTTSYTYGAPYTVSSATRGFDDVVFQGSNVYLSETNPGSATDPVVVQVNNSSSLASPVTLTSILARGTLLATDPDSLKANPNGGLVLTGEADAALTFVNNPGQSNQTATSVKLVTSTGASPGSPDDSVFATATAGTFYVADGGANTVYAITGTGLTPDSLFVDAGTSFNSVDPATGIVTPIFTGTSPHGADFVANASAVPEPASVALSLAGILLGGIGLWRRRAIR